MEIVFSLLIALIGVLMYALCTNGKLQEIGKIMFFCGLFVFLLQFAPGRIISALPKG